MLLYAKEKNGDYENFYATCPYCKHKNIFNRKSDLGTSELISFKTVTCLSEDCGHEFNINGDDFVTAYEMLIYDSHALFREKKYAYCILNLAQAYEVFFSFFLNLRLVYSPFYREEDNTAEELNEISRKLYEKIEKCTYHPMKNIAFNLIIDDINPETIAESETVISSLQDRGCNIPTRKFESIGDDELKKILIRIESRKIDVLRNKVVHKMAYRPSTEETEVAINETRADIFGIDRLLGVKSDCPLIMIT